MRIDKLKADSARDARQFAEFQPLLQHYQRARRTARRRGWIRVLSEFRWLLEELRISLFAQELRTPMPVSVKRLLQGVGVDAALSGWTRGGCGAERRT